MRVQCPAKINLDLRVGPVRADGFHPIRSWFVTVGLFDTLMFAPADDLTMTCDDPTVPTDGRNLVLRAAALLRPAGGPGAAITLEKKIPAGGGLGGGSSDAAATLLALNDFWNLGHGHDRLHAIAMTLGSDVPFFLTGGSAVCTGRGEVVTPVPPPGARWAVLILPPIAMPTPTVFRRLDELRAGRTIDIDDSAPPPVDTNALSLLPRLVNDLETPAFALRPDLADLRSTAERALGRPVRMSGSGSTLFTLYDTEAEAVAATSDSPARAVAVALVPSPGMAGRGLGRGPPGVDRRLERCDGPQINIDKHG